MSDYKIDSLVDLVVVINIGVYYPAFTYHLTVRLEIYRSLLLMCAVAYAELVENFDEPSKMEVA